MPESISFDCCRHLHVTFVSTRKDATAGEATSSERRPRIPGHSREGDTTMDHAGTANVPCTALLAANKIVSRKRALSRQEMRLAAAPIAE